MRGFGCFLHHLLASTGMLHYHTLTVTSYNEYWTQVAASSPETSLPHKLYHYCLPFAGTVLQDQGLGQLHKSMERGYFTRLSEMTKRFSSKYVKGKKVSHPVRKDSDHKNCILLCSNLSLAQKWELMTSGHRR